MLNLPGKPRTFLEVSHMLGVEPRAAAVFEDALADVAARHAGAFGFVVGVDRVGQEPESRAHGADVVVRDLADLLLFRPLARTRAGRPTGERCP